MCAAIIVNTHEPIQITIWLLCSGQWLLSFSLKINTQHYFKKRKGNFSRQKRRERTSLPEHTNSRNTSSIKTYQPNCFRIFRLWHKIWSKGKIAGKMNWRNCSLTPGMDRSVQDHHYYKKITVRHLISFKPRKNFFVRGLSSCNDLKISEK